jgi:adenylate cyclase class 2
MYEVELKVRAAHDPLRDRLDDAGLTFQNRVRQIDTYYDAPHRDFAATDEALRVREESPFGPDGTAGEATTAVTYKGPLVDDRSKTREEHETAVADGDAVGDILDALGFEPAATVEKDRERYVRDGYTVTLDAVAGLGEFVEVETEVVESGDGTAPPDLAPARAGARDLLRELGLDPGDGIRTSYLGMLLADDGTADG